MRRELQRIQFDEDAENPREDKGFLCLSKFILAFFLKGLFIIWFGSFFLISIFTLGLYPVAVLDEFLKDPQGMNLVALIHVATGFMHLAYCVASGD